jgi:hypothetical protein
MDPLPFTLQLAMLFGPNGNAFFYLYLQVFDFAIPRRTVMRRPRKYLISLPRRVVEKMGRQ